MNQRMVRNTDWQMPEYIWRRTSNETYNKKWVELHGLKFSEKMSLEELESQGIDVVDASAYQVVWLKNIDRLMDMTPPSFSPMNYTLLDVGCGAGISTLYFLSTCPFREFIGFDFSSDLIRNAKSNHLLFANQCDNPGLLSFMVENARNYQLADVPNFIFMFNPFGFETAKTFILNNVAKLKRNSCLLAIANDVWVEELLEMQHHKHAVRDNFNNLTMVLY